MSDDAGESALSPAAPKGRGGALAVGAGILLSRIAGLVRSRALAHYLGQTPAAGAFTAALRIPNMLQNLFGEGVLSASFIPVYARLLAEGRTQDATRVARAIATLLMLAASVITLLGMVLADTLVDFLVPGFKGSTRELTVTLVRILFPGVALLVLSAWCLGVLNSHRRFFLSYVSPVLWNLAIIAAVLAGGRRFVGDLDSIAVWVAWGAVIGSAAQLGIQLPLVLKLVRGYRPTLAVRDKGVQTTLRAFAPVLLGRGSVQLSGYIDQVLASYLGEAIVAAMGNAQILYLLPVSLFGMAVSAAELPEMSSATGEESDRAVHLQKRLKSALRQVVFLVVPSAVAFIAIGGLIAGLLFEGGRFTAHDSEIVWIILAGSAIGLSAGTQGRLLGSAFYALGDTKRPLYAALVRVTITGVAGWAFALPIRHALGYSAEWGAFGLTASAGFAAWVEFLLLRIWLDRRIGRVPIPTRLGFGALAAAAVAGGIAYGAGQLVLHASAKHWAAALLAIPVFGGVYLAIMAIARVPEVNGLTRRFLLRRR